MRIAHWRYDFILYQALLCGRRIRFFKEDKKHFSQATTVTRRGMNMERTYEDAIRIIESRQRQTRPNPAALRTEPEQQMPMSSGKPDLRGVPSIVGMAEWLQMLGHSEADTNALNVIHVAGTKGKGSTCAFIESFLRAHGQRTGYPSKTGLYTSPHLILPEERIRLNSKPIEPTLFAKYFFEIYEMLPQLSLSFDPDKPVVERGPRYLQIFALLAFHVFIREKVDVAILETHNGGQYDATNVVRKPIVTAVTTLGMDHVASLGPSIENIAWHKSGIYKPGAVALSTVQDPAPAEVLEKRARDQGEGVRFVGEDERLPMNDIQLKPTVQRKNASLALVAVEAFLERRAPEGADCLSKEDMKIGVSQWLWPGRFQTINDENTTWYLDAAHNQMSMSIAARWFADIVAETGAAQTRCLIFSHISEIREATDVLQSLAKALKECDIEMTHVIFTTYHENEEVRPSASARDPSLFHEAWKNIFPDAILRDESTIQGAIDFVRGVSNGNQASRTQTLITGSQHLVGPALKILKAD